MLTLAAQGARWCREYAQRYLPDARVDFQYTPESFTGTETEYAGHVCSAVIEQWQPSIHREVIINAAATVELSSPNHFADKVESLRRLLGHYGEITLSLHCHNDRGCAVAATELGQMAGAERVEGTLFGNGERTGNVDLITLAMNLYTQGIDPKLDFSDLDEIASIYAACTHMNVHDRHPYAGRLVHCAFSGTHQDAINKGLSSLQSNGNEAWDVPYLPVDPRDVGRSLEDIVRINAQSGRGGIARILSSRFSVELSKEDLAALAVKVQEYCDRVGREVTAEEVRMFLTAPESRQNAEILG
jgi:2-isopropylmalate synthase